MNMPMDKFRILKDLDVEAARPAFVALVGEPIQEPGKGDPILASLHKARIMAGRVFNGRERAMSADWLIRNGYEVPTK